MIIHIYSLRSVSFLLLKQVPLQTRTDTSTERVFTDGPKGVFAYGRASCTHQMICENRYFCVRVGAPARENQRFACRCLFCPHAKIKKKNQKSRNPNPRSRHRRHLQRGRRCSNPLPPSSSWSAHRGIGIRAREEGGTKSAAHHRCRRHARGVVGSTIVVASPTHHHRICLP